MYGEQFIKAPRSPSFPRRRESSGLEEKGIFVLLDSRLRGNDGLSQRPAKRLMQQRLLQLGQCGQLTAVEGFEALGFGGNRQ